MPINPSEFRMRSLRVHTFLSDVPLEDVWEIFLPGGGTGRTIQDVRDVFAQGTKAASPMVQGLFRLRGWMGTRFGWDHSRPEWNAESYAHRLSAEDIAQSTAASGTPDGRLDFLYRFENEQLSERRNATVHAFMSLSMHPTPGGYLAYLAVYVRPVHPLTRLYMLAIRPFRHLIVYPAMVQNVQRTWDLRFGGENSNESQ